MLFRSIYKSTFELGAFALLSIGLIALFHWMTKDKIEAEMQAKLARTLGELVSPSEYDNDVYHDCIVFDSKGLLHASEPTRFYRMTKNNKPVAAIFTVTTPKGYNGDIQLIMGIYANQKIAGVRTIQHNETPGLGDKIDLEKSNWITQFTGLSLDNTPEDQWKVKKDGGQFDAFTGATITPRAVLNAIKNGLEFFKQHQNELFNKPNKCGAIDEH
ncbi:electron transport complex subunit RsxG [Pleionea sediminis]|uniref:electron transport complex subunit RsxG n=1 Tax=Pleionea sediminis TaxID=2569479 RepID=UPI0011865A5F|nr:electron transport complex subunit RsxG [Pleionea sediminis]